MSTRPTPRQPNSARARAPSHGYATIDGRVLDDQASTTGAVAALERRSAWDYYLLVLPDDAAVEPPTAVDFVVLTALEEEREAVLRKLPAACRLPPSGDDNRVYFHTTLPVTFPDGSAGAYVLVCHCLCGMGRVQAALSAADAIRRWRPRFVILVGIAGGVAQRGVKLGDVLVSDQVVDYELQRQGPDASEVRWDVHRCDQALLEAVRNDRGIDWRARVLEQRPEAGLPERHIGPVASGDKVVKVTSFLAKYLEKWPRIIGIEMEAHGAAAAAFQAKDRPGFLMVRGVSDLADDQAATESVKIWRDYACDVAASYAIGLLQAGPVTVASRPQEPRVATNRNGHSKAWLPAEQDVPAKNFLLRWSPPATGTTQELTVHEDTRMTMTMNHGVGDQAPRRILQRHQCERTYLVAAGRLPRPTVFELRLTPQSAKAFSEVAGRRSHSVTARRVDDRIECRASDAALDTCPQLEEVWRAQMETVLLLELTTRGIVLGVRREPSPAVQRPSQVSGKIAAALQWIAGEAEFGSFLANFTFLTFPEERIGAKVEWEFPREMLTMGARFSGSARAHIDGHDRSDTGDIVRIAEVTSFDIDGSALAREMAAAAKVTLPDWTIRPESASAKCQPVQTQCIFDSRAGHLLMQSSSMQLSVSTVLAAHGPTGDARWHADQSLSYRLRLEWASASSASS